MSVYNKLTEARVRIQNMDLKKSGENKFVGFKYFELGDFIPQAQSIFNDLKLCGFVSFTPELATLQIVDAEDGTMLAIYSPIAMATLKGAHDVQNLGATQTYLRRYLWMAALELTESDWVDATIGSEPPPKPVAQKKPEPKPQAKTSAPPKHIEGQDGDWKMTIKVKDGATAEEYADGVIAALEVALSATYDVDSTTAVYRNNSAIFKEIKDRDPETFDRMVSMFKERKAHFESEGK